MFLDPSYQGCVPILDGTDGASEHVLYGTNINWQKAKENDNTSNENPGLEEPVDKKQVVDKDVKDTQQDVKEDKKQVVDKDVKEDEEDKKQVVDEDGREIKQQVKEEEKQVIEEDKEQVVEEDVKEDEDTKQDMKENEDIQSKM